MSKNTPKQEVQQPEKKERSAVWLYPSTWETIERSLGAANCKSRSEFLEEAAKFYAGYVSGRDAVAYLPEILVSAIRGTLEGSENRTSRLLFKLAVEVDMMMKVLAAGIEVTPKELDDLRAQCVYDVKKTNGSISYKESVERIRYGQ